MTTYRERLKAGHHDAKKIEAKEAKANDESKTKSASPSSSKKS